MSEKYTKLCDSLRTRFSQLDEKRETWVPGWIDQRDYILPYHGRTLTDKSPTDQNDGKRRGYKIINSVQTYALNVMAAGMQSGLTSPARPWFRLGLRDEDLTKFGPVKEWLFEVETRMKYVMSMSNIYNGFHHTYLELGAFGTAATALLEDYDNVVRARPFSAGEYWLGTNDKGVVDTIYRVLFLTAVQMIEKFGKENVDRTVVDAYDRKNTEQMFKVMHVIEPNDDRVDLKEAQKKPWRAIYVAKYNPDNKILRGRGYDEFPAITPRWDVAGNDVYGHGPGDLLIGDIKMLQKMEEKALVALDKQIEPPVVAPGTMEDDEINTIPGGVSYENSVASQGQGLRAIYQVNANLQHMEAKIQSVMQGIKTGFYNDLFLAITQMPTHQMTATEIAERHEEKMVMLGPVLERLHYEMLDPSITRVYSIMARYDMFPPPPEEIQGGEFTVEYTSILAAAQKAVGLTGIEKFSNFVASVAQVKPAALDKIDIDQAIDEYADGLGVPPTMVVPNDEVLELRKARAEEEKQMKQQMQMQQMIESAKTASEIDVGGGQNAVEAMMGGAAAGGMGAPQQ